MRSAAVLAATLLATACANLAPLPQPTSTDAFSGRLAIRVDPLGSEAARAFSAAFELRGDPRSGALGLSTPLGSVLAQARWSPSEVTLKTPQGTRSFTDLDTLTRELIGQSVPIEAWFEWLHGRPWPSAASLPASGAGSADFEQLGWAVDLGRFAEGRILATRQRPAPVVTVRIQLDPS